MRINSIQNQSYTNPKFGSFYREVTVGIDDLTQKVVHRNNTQILRPNAKYWSDLFYFLDNKYKDIPHVNVYFCSCSVGLEPYGFAISAITRHGPDRARKYLPLEAWDYDPYVIKIAKSGVTTLDSTEMINVDQASKYKSGMFFRKKELKYGKYKANEYLGGAITAYGGTYEVMPILRNNVNFGVGNILDNYTKINPNNSIVFADNFWPYLGEREDELAEKFRNQLRNNCTLVIGEFDHKKNLKGENTPILLSKAGFSACEVPNVYLSTVR